MIFLTLCACISDADCWVNVERYDKKLGTVPARWGDLYWLSKDNTLIHLDVGNITSSSAGSLVEFYLTRLGVEDGKDILSTTGLEIGDSPRAVG